MDHQGKNAAASILYHCHEARNELTKKKNKKGGDTTLNIRNGGGRPWEAGRAVTETQCQLNCDNM